MAIKKIFNWLIGFILWINPFVVIAIFYLTLTHMLALNGKRIELLFEENKIYTPFTLFTMWWLIILYYPSDLNPFIYFQF